MSMLVYVAAKIQSALAEKRNMSYPNFCLRWNSGVIFVAVRGLAKEQHNSPTPTTPL